MYSQAKHYLVVGHVKTKHVKRQTTIQSVLHSKTKKKIVIGFHKGVLLFSQPHLLYSSVSSVHSTRVPFLNLNLFYDTKRLPNKYVLLCIICLPPRIWSRSIGLFNNIDSSSKVSVLRISSLSF